jgi:IS5 family transposase
VKQISLLTTGFELVVNRTRERLFLDEMNLVVPWTELVRWIQPCAPSAGARGGKDLLLWWKPCCAPAFLQQWFRLSEPALEEARQDFSLYREISRLDPGALRLLDESTILRFRHLLEEKNLSIQLPAIINAKSGLANQNSGKGALI